MRLAHAVTNYFHVNSTLPPPYDWNADAAGVDIGATQEQTNMDKQAGGVGIVFGTLVALAAVVFHRDRPGSMGGKIHRRRPRPARRSQSRDRARPSRADLFPALTKRWLIAVHSRSSRRWLGEGRLRAGRGDTSRAALPESPSTTDAGEAWTQSGVHAPSSLIASLCALVPDRFLAPPPQGLAVR